MYNSLLALFSKTNSLEEQEEFAHSAAPQIRWLCAVNIHDISWIVDCDFELFIRSQPTSRPTVPYIELVVPTCTLAKFPVGLRLHSLQITITITHILLIPIGIFYVSKAQGRGKVGKTQVQNCKGRRAFIYDVGPSLVKTTVLNNSIEIVKSSLTSLKAILFNPSLKLTLNKHNRTAL